MPDLSAAPFLQRALNRKDAMTARIKTEAEALADLEQAVDRLAAEFTELAVRAETIGRRLTALQSCPGCTKYATEPHHDDDCTERCGYCGAIGDTHDDDCKPSYRTPALLSQDEADLVEKLTGTRYES